MLPDWDDRLCYCVAGSGRSSVLLCRRIGTVVCAIVFPDWDDRLCYGKKWLVAAARLPDWDGRLCYCVAGSGRSSVLLCRRTGTIVCAIVLPDWDDRLCYGKKWLVAAARLPDWDGRLCYCVAGSGRSSVLLCRRIGTVVCAIVSPDWDDRLYYCVAGLGRSSVLLCRRTGTIVFAMERSGWWQQRVCRTGTVVYAIVLPDRDDRLCYGMKSGALSTELSPLPKLSPLPEMRQHYLILWTACGSVCSLVSLDSGNVCYTSSDNLDPLRQ